MDQAEGTSFGNELQTLDVHRERGHMIDDVFYHLDLKTDPSSPFYSNEMPPMSSTMAGPAPAPKPAPSAAPDPAPSASPDPAPSAEPRQPIFEEVAASNPDGITTEHNGRIVEARPDSQGEMVIHDYGEPQQDNKNEGNSKTRTGSEDDRKKDKDKQPNTSGGGNNSNGNSNSGGGMNHKK